MSTIFRVSLFMAACALLPAGCTPEAQQDGEHGVAVEDTTLLADSTAAFGEMPAVLEEATTAP